MRVVDVILSRHRLLMRVADAREQSKKGNAANIAFGLKQLAQLEFLFHK